MKRSKLTLKTTTASRFGPHITKKKKKRKELSKSQSHLFRRKILHPSRHTIPKYSEIPGGEGRRVLAEIVEILPCAMIPKIGQQFPVHHVLEYEIMRLCEQQTAIIKLHADRKINWDWI